jgi:hypothetical protein
MAKGVVGVSFNVVLTSDDQLMLEWQLVDPINRQAKKCVTIHKDFPSLAKQLERVLQDAQVMKL